MTVFSFCDIKELINKIQYLNKKFGKLLRKSKILDQPRGLKILFEEVEPYKITNLFYAIKLSQFVEIQIAMPVNIAWR